MSALVSWKVAIQNRNGITGRKRCTRKCRRPNAAIAGTSAIPASRVEIAAAPRSVIAVSRGTDQGPSSGSVSRMTPQSAAASGRSESACVVKCSRSGCNPHNSPTAMAIDTGSRRAK